MTEPFDSQAQGRSLPPPGAPVPPPGAFVPPPPPSPPAAPTPAAGSPFLPPTQPVYQTTQPVPTAVMPMTEVTLTPEQPPRRRSKGKMIGALAGVVVLLGAGTFAVAQISDNDSNGGAASPEDLGQKLVDAFTNEDVLGAVDLLLPGERETFRQPMIDLVNELNRLEVLSDSADLNKVAGFDIQIDDVDVNVDPTNVDDISNVSITGSSTITVDGDQVPIGDLITSLSPDGERPDLSTDEQDDDFNLNFTSVEKDGRWYVSLFYSAAESARGDREVPEEGVAPQGAASPEDALDNLLTSVGDLDLESVIAGLNPNEAEALQRYAPLFIDDAQSELDDLDVKIDVSGGEYDVAGSGDTRQVAVRALTVDVTADDETVSFTLEDGCITGEVGGESFDSCEQGQDSVDQTIEDYFSGFGVEDTSAITTLIEDVQDALSDFSMHGIVVDKVNGEWYVSPIGTYLEFQLSILRALDRSELETLIDDFKNVFESFETSFEADTSDTVTPTTDDTGTPATDVPAAATDYFECLFDLPADQAQTCISDGIASGNIDPSTVPAPLQFPDCGLFDYYAGSTIYTDSAADFHATVDPASSCIVDAAGTAGLDLTLITPEFTNPECFTDVNPYNYTDDSDAVSKAYDCAYSS